MSMPDVQVSAYRRDRIEPDGLRAAGCIVPSKRTVTVGEKNALKAAWQWVSAEARDPASYEFHANADGTNWSLLVEST